jgi:hypothetical protein
LREDINQYRTLKGEEKNEENEINGREKTKMNGKSNVIKKI